MTTNAEAKAAADDIGYPVVVKPRGLTASFGVSPVAGPGEMAEAVGCAQSNAFPEPWEFRHGILVEEFLDGLEISVDSAVPGDQARPLIFAGKVLGFALYFEELGIVTGHDPQYMSTARQAGATPPRPA